MATFANPADTSCRDTSHEGIVGHIVCDNSSGSNQCTTTDIVSTDNSTVGTERCSLFDSCFGVDAMHWEVGAGCCNVGEDATGTAEDVIFDGDTLIDRYVVLYAYPIAYMDIVTDVDVLTHRAVCANTCSFLDMAEMPHLGIFANHNVVIDVTAFVYKCLAHYCLCYCMILMDYCLLFEYFKIPQS